IRDPLVTGVQTCALPIYADTTGARGVVDERVEKGDFAGKLFAGISCGRDRDRQAFLEQREFVLIKLGPDPNEVEIGDVNQVIAQIGRASCRERVEMRR